MNFVDIYQRYWKNGYTLTDLSLSGIDREVFRSLFNQVAEVFRKYPAGDVHLYIPGVGQVSGLQPGNYFDSAGTTLASTDGSVGLVLDAAGSVGVELIPYGTAGSSVGNPGALPTNWQGSVTINGVSRQVTGVAADYIDLRLTGTSTNTWADFLGVIGSTIAVTPGQTIKFSLPNTTVVAGAMPSGGNISYGAVLQLNGAFVSQVASQSGVVTIPNGVNQLRLYNTIANYSNGVTVDVTVRVPGTASVKQITGTHATQSTPGYKPTLRKGIVNLLTWSNDLTNAAWNVSGGASKSAQTLNTPSAGAGGYSTPLSSAGAYTMAFLLSGSGTAGIWAWNATDGTLAYQTITLSATPTLYLGYLSPTGTNTALNFGRNGGGTATSINFHGAGLFAGTLTAQQIIAAGGIPLTTTAPASSSAGNAYWEFDGVDDRLSLGGPLFQMSDDHCVVVGFKPDVISAYRAPFFPAANAATTARAGVIGVAPGGAIAAYYTNDAGGLFSPQLGTVVANEAFVASVRKVGSQFKGRKNGGAFCAPQTPTGTFTLDTAAIGYAQGFAYADGSVYPMLAIKGTVSDADLIVLEKFVCGLSGVAL